MQLQAERLYHVYNRGNNRQPIFFSPENYRYFLVKMRKLVGPHVHVLAWCLMPNHFHWLLQLRADAESKAFSAGLRSLLSSYSRAINVQEGRSGSLFQQHTRAKEPSAAGYALNCFCYIHQNPLQAGLETVAGHWPWSSFRDYGGLRSGNLCDVPLATELLDLPAEPQHRKALMRQLQPEEVRTHLH